MLDDIFMQVLDMSKTGSIVILFVLSARLLLRRAPKVFSYALWAVVLLRLLCPVSLGQTTVSLVPEIPPTAQDYALSDEPITVLEAGNAALNAVGDALNGGLGTQIIDTTEVEPDGSRRTVTTDWYDIPILFGQYVWLAGAGCMILRSLISYRKLRRKIGIAISLRDNLYLADDLESPFVVGLIHPKIYLPSNLSQREYDYIILHEQHHIRRGDHIIKALAFLTLCIHWFNPLVWLAFHLASKDMEMSCDEAVVRKAGADIRADYAASLLSLATGQRIIAGTPLAFGEGDPRGRIRNLAKWKKPAIWVCVLAVILCAVLGVCLLTDRAVDVTAEGNTWYSGTVVDCGMTAVREGERAVRGYLTLETADGDSRVFHLSEGTKAPHDIIGEYMVVRSRTEPVTGLMTMVSMHAAEPIEYSSLEDALRQSIIAHNAYSMYDQLCQTASFRELSREADGDRITVYGIACHCVYGLEDSILLEEGGSNGPAVMTFHRSEDGNYQLMEYWEPRDGTYYPTDIRAMFRGRPYPDTQKYITEQILDTYAQAMEHYGVGTDVVINTILEDICIREQWNDSFDGLMENCSRQRTMLMTYGRDTLRYCFAQFMDGGQSDLRSRVMAYVCQEIMEEMGEALLIESQPENGQDWFAAFTSNAETLLTQFRAETLQQMYPASYLYLQMAGRLPDHQISSIATANGFEIRLYSEKTFYRMDEAVILWATLEYKGDGNRITIWHGEPYITFSVSDGGDFESGGVVLSVLTSTTLKKGQVYRYEFAKSGGYGETDPNADFWESYYRDPQLHLPAGTYTVSVDGGFYLSPEQHPTEKGPSCKLEITVTE